MFCGQKGQEYRYKNLSIKEVVDYFWYTAKDDSGVKFMFQQKHVAYADYQPDKFYVSVFEVEPVN